VTRQLCSQGLRTVSQRLCHIPSPEAPCDELPRQAHRDVSLSSSRRAPRMGLRTCGLLLLLPTDFKYPVFAAVLALLGISIGMFASPNRAAVINSLPRSDHGAGAR
jgi:hypothetical protein